MRLIRVGIRTGTLHFDCDASLAARLRKSCGRRLKYEVGCAGLRLAVDEPLEIEDVVIWGDAVTWNLISEFAVGSSG
jgi:hypothetical protein